MEISETILKTKIVEALYSNGVESKVTSIDLVTPPALKGEHFATETLYATIHFFDESFPSKNLFVKKYSNNSVHTEMIKKMRVMEKESAFFNKVLPELRKFSKKFPGCENLLNFFPKFLFGDDTCIILENVVLDGGYVMLDKEEMQDFETAKIVFCNLAKFHACSYVFIETIGRDKFAKEFELSIIESIGLNEGDILPDMLSSGIDTCVQILKSNTLPGNAEIIEKLNNVLNTIIPEVTELLNRDDSEPLLVVNHGDCWNNNMLFKIDTETGFIIDHIFIDLQLTRYGSPCLDLGYYYFTSINPKVRKAHWQDFLHLYYDQFDRTVQLLGTKCPITYDDLVKDFKRFSKFGYFLTLSMQASVPAFQAVNVDKLEGGTNLLGTIMIKFKSIAQEWTKNNPEKGNVVSQNIVDLIQEFQQLQT